MPEEKQSGPVLLIALVVIIGLLLYIVSHDQRESAIAPPAPAPGLHVSIDLPLGRVKPDAAHVLTGQPDPYEGKATFPADPNHADLSPAIPVTHWEWIASHDQWSLPCNQEGFDADGNPVANRSWKKRWYDGKCHVEDALPTP